MRLAAQDRREKLLSAATRLFATRGFDGVSTREIAHAADINEALIFRHFASKEELYAAVVAEAVRSTGLRRNMREWLTSGLDDRAILVGVARKLLDRTADDVALTRLLLFNALRPDKPACAPFRTSMCETFDLLKDFIAHRVSAGHFREVDPEVAARGFLGMIVYHFLQTELMGRAQAALADTQCVAEQLTDLWLQGVSQRVAVEVSASENRERLDRSSAGSQRMSP